jgi:hypothetical protein
MMRRSPARAALVTVLVAASFAGSGRAEAPPRAPSRPSAARPDLETMAPSRPGRPAVERDPGREPRPHEPVFVGPAATTTRRARVGLSAWIAPGAPFDRRESPGGVALGLTVAWPPPSGHEAPPHSAP